MHLFAAKGSPSDITTSHPLCHPAAAAAAVNIALWYYAQQNTPAKKQKKVGVKKMKRETLKQGMRVLGD
jgi:hypothetical protein